MRACGFPARKRGSLVDPINSMRSGNLIQIDITNEQSRLTIVEERLREVVAAVLAGEGQVQPRSAWPWSMIRRFTS